MSNTKYYSLLTLVVVAAFALGTLFIKEKTSAAFGDVNTGSYDTVTQGIVSTTSTVNTTSTLLVSFNSTAATSTTTNAVKWATIINNGASIITCALDDRGTTAASSSVGINKGFVIATSTAGAIPALVSVGQCSGFYNCIPAMGNVSCLSNGAADLNVTVIRK